MHGNSYGLMHMTSKLQFNVKLEEDDPCARAIDLAEIQVMEEEEVEVMFEGWFTRWEE